MLNNTDINLPGNETTTITRNYMFPGQFNAGFLGNGSVGDIDEIYIFPSKSIHSTSPNKTNEERISISADISIITKESENIENFAFGFQVNG